jgi:hypothetical protein
VRGKPIVSLEGDELKAVALGVWEDSLAIYHQIQPIDEAIEQMGSRETKAAERHRLDEQVCMMLEPFPDNHFLVQRYNAVKTRKR